MVAGGDLRLTCLAERGMMDRTPFPALCRQPPPRTRVDDSPQQKAEDTP